MQLKNNFQDFFYKIQTYIIYKKQFLAISNYAFTLFFVVSSNRHISSELMLLSEVYELLTIWGASLNSSSSSSSAEEGPANKMYCSERVGHNKCAITQYAKQSALYVMPAKTKTLSKSTIWNIQSLPKSNLNLHKADTCNAISANIGKYMNQTKLDAPKCKRKFNFCVLCSYNMVVRNSYRNQTIINERKTIINQPGHVWYSSMSSMISTSV